MKKIQQVIRPTICPRCHKPYKEDKRGRCVHCGAWLGMIKW